MAPHMSQTDPAGMTSPETSEPMYRHAGRWIAGLDQLFPDARVVNTVSVIIPAYNAEQYVEAAIDAALLQEGVQVEVLVIDD